MVDSGGKAVVENVAYPGVKTLNEAAGERRQSHKYYQWVYFVLIIQVSWLGWISNGYLLGLLFGNPCQVNGMAFSRYNEGRRTSVALSSITNSYKNDYSFSGRSQRTEREGLMKRRV